MRDRYIHIISCLILCILFSTSAVAAIHRHFPLRYQITGIDNAIVKKNAELALHNFRSELSIPITQKAIHHFVKKAPKYIQSAVEPYGYFKSQVQSQLTQTSDGWYVTFHVALGKPLPITAIRLQIIGAGKTDHRFVAFLKNLPFAVGSPLQTELYEKAKTELYDIATERGYFQAKMREHQIKINLQRYHATVVIVFDTGPRFRFGSTTFSKSPFHEKFLKRFLQYQKGHYFNAKKLEKTQEGLVASNYFDQVTPKIKTKLAKNNNEVPIYFALIPRKAKAYTFGLGYGTDTGGIRGTIGYSLRHIGKDGHRFHTLLRASPNNSGLTAKYIIPGPHPARDLFTISGGISNVNQATGIAHNAKFGPGYTIFSDHWKSSLTLAYLTERYNFTGSPFISTQLLYPTFETKYTKTDHVTNPKNGITVELRLTGADKNILSETDFFQVTAHLNTLYTINKTNTRLLFRSDVGHTNIANLVNLPLSLQLFAGGSRSVRGYGYNSIGPGRNLAVASAEVQQKIIASLYLTGFVDAGVAGNQHIFQSWNVGSGPGIAWVSSIGTIELTAAEAITYPNQPWTIQFTMGSAI